MEETQTSFKTREVYDLIHRQYHGLKKDYENNFALKLRLQHQIISPQRALAMAKNIFMHGDFKRLRESIRQYKKDEQRLVPACRQSPFRNNLRRAFCFEFLQ